jgi:MEMO1 family protein
MEYRRKSIVAGSFYDADKESLSQQISNCFLHEIGPQRLPEHRDNVKNERKISGVISPHAGFIFSGPIAAHHFLRLSYEKTPQTIIIIGPNHRGLGNEIAIMSAGYWETPLGNIEIDEQLAKDIMNYDDRDLIVEDLQAHTFEHSIEVQLPFLQFIYPNNQFKIIPICISNQQLVNMKYLADTIFIATKEKSCLLIASSDFTHYESQESAKRKDTEAIDKIISMDSKLFYDTISRKEASICGPGPIAIVIEVCKKLGIKKGKLLKYATSGDVSGMNDQVVGYASIIFE